MAYNTLPLRPHVTPTMGVITLIARGTCWHFDAWLYRDEESTLYYVRVETRRGGRELLTSHAYVYEPRTDTFRYAPDVPARTVPATIHDKALWPDADALNRLHWTRIIPMTQRVPAGFKSRSVALHYIRAPSLAPLSGDEPNLHAYA